MYVVLPHWTRAFLLPLQISGDVGMVFPNRNPCFSINGIFTSILLILFFTSSRQGLPVDPETLVKKALGRLSISDVVSNAHVMAWKLSFSRLQCWANVNLMFFIEQNGDDVYVRWPGSEELLGRDGWAVQEPDRHWCCPCLPRRPLGGTCCCSASQVQRN